MEATMDTRTLDRSESLHAYLSLSEIARLLGIATSTLSRRDDVHPLERGSRDRVLPPAEVMRLAAIYRKRSLNEVAQDLIDLAAKHGQAEADRTEESIEAFFVGRSRSESVDEFLEQAKRHLPGDLYAEVEKTVRDGGGRRPAAIVGHVPAPAPLKRRERRSAAGKGAAAATAAAKKPVTKKPVATVKKKKAATPVAQPASGASGKRKLAKVAS